MGIESRVVLKPETARPPVQWQVEILELAEAEAVRLLTEDQYWQIAEQVHLLASEADPTHPTTTSVDAIGSVFELRCKGGRLGKINLRVYFGLIRADGARSLKVLVVLKVLKKESEGQLPSSIRQVVERRMRLFEEARRQDNP